MTTRREALVLLAGSTAGVALPIGFSAGASMENTTGSAESSAAPVLTPERRWLAVDYLSSCQFVRSCCHKCGLPLFARSRSYLILLES